MGQIVGGEQKESARGTDSVFSLPGLSKRMAPKHHASSPGAAVLFYSSYASTWTGNKHHSGPLWRLPLPLKKWFRGGISLSIRLRIPQVQGPIGTSLQQPARLPHQSPPKDLPGEQPQVCYSVMLWMSAEHKRTQAQNQVQQKVYLLP